MPRPKLPEAARRSVLLRLSLTPPEAEDLNRRAAAAGLGREDYARRVLFGEIDRLGRGPRPEWVREEMGGTTLTLRTPPPDAVSASSSVPVEVRHAAPVPDISGARLRAGVAEIGGTFAPESDMAGAVFDPPAAPSEARILAEASTCHLTEDSWGPPAPIPPTIAPVAQPTPCPKCNGTGRIGTPPVRFRCPECLGAGSLARP